MWATLPIRDVVLLPGSILSLRIGRPSAVAAVRWAMEHEKPLAVALQTSELDSPGPEDLFQVGTVAEILTASRETPSEAVIELLGIERVELTRVDASLFAETRALEWNPVSPPMPEHYPDALSEFIDEFVRPRLTEESNARLRPRTPAEQLAAMAAFFVEANVVQRVLETADLGPVVEALKAALRPSLVTRVSSWLRTSLKG